MLSECPSPGGKSGTTYFIRVNALFWPPVPNQGVVGVDMDILRLKLGKEPGPFEPGLQSSHGEGPGFFYARTGLFNGSPHSFSVIRR